MKNLRTLAIVLISCLTWQCVSPEADGQVATYPAYNGSPDASTWKYGTYDGTDLNGTYQGITGSGNVAWFLRSIELKDIAFSRCLLSQLRFVGTFLATECDAVYFSIASVSGSTLTNVTLGNGLTYIDITAYKGADATHQVVADLGDVEFTPQAGTTYHMCLWMRGTANRAASHPGSRSMLAGKGPAVSAKYAVIVQSAFPATASGTDETYTLRMELEFKTASRIVQESDYSTAKEIITARRTDGDYWIKCSDVVVADGQALTSILAYDLNADDAARTTMVLDMGATDQVTFGAANVALAAAGAEAGDTFDLGINVRPVTGKMDLFYQNRTTGQGAEGAADFTTISHACKNGSARAAVYTVASPSWLTMSGTASVGTIQVCSEMVVVYGDSQCSYAGHRFSENLPSAFEYPRAVWHGWINGNRLTETVGGAHTAGYLRYKHGTPGLGDLCEMTGVLFAICGFGVNDVSSGIGTTETNRNKLTALLGTRIAEILDDLQDRAVPTLIIGLSPYSDGNASTQEAKAIQHQINPMLEGLAIGVRAAYVNPWWAMCQGGTSEADVPTFAAAYTSDGGLHYSQAGNLIVSQMAAKAVETGIIGGWWSAPWRRLSRQKGSLFPI